MVGRVLTRHGVVKRDGKRFSLLSARPLSKEQRAELRQLLEAKLDQYVAKRGERIWQHRKLGLGDISGTIKYEVLRRASTRCELCGVSNGERVLEVDHILPRNHGGSDDIANLQALCYSCNAMKRDRDATDFRALRESYAHREKACLFCARQRDGPSQWRTSYVLELRMAIQLPISICWSYSSDTCQISLNSMSRRNTPV